MAGRIWLLALCVVALCAGCQGEPRKEPPAVKRAATSTPETGSVNFYGAQSGIITYRIKFLGEQTQVYYFEDSGVREARLSTIELLGVRMESWKINSQGLLIRYDPASKTGTKTASMGSIGVVQGVPTDFSAWDDRRREFYNFRELPGTKTMLGRACRGFTFDVMGMPIEVWAWGNIPLYVKLSLAKEREPMEITATRMELDVPVPSGVFSVPAEIMLVDSY